MSSGSRNELLCNLLLVCWMSFKCCNDDTQMQWKIALVFQVGKIQHSALHKISIFNIWRARDEKAVLWKNLHAAIRSMHWRPIENKNNNIKETTLKEFNWYFNTPLVISEWTQQFWYSCWAECRPEKDHTVLLSACYYFFNKTFIPHCC